ncbi:hypothetical protein, partial [Clostridium disporicum]|uniref:hypothetical protein n=1 Tax=Clostridium disporicum TaxID=84024 RepID=UPI0034A4B19A
YYTIFSNVSSIRIEWGDLMGIYKNIKYIKINDAKIYDIKIKELDIKDNKYSIDKDYCYNAK